MEHIVSYNHAIMQQRAQVNTFSNHMPQNHSSFSVQAFISSLKTKRMVAIGKEMQCKKSISKKAAQRTDTTLVIITIEQKPL